MARMKQKAATARKAPIIDRSKPRVHHDYGVKFPKARVRKLFKQFFPEARFGPVPNIAVTLVIEGLAEHIFKKTIRVPYAEFVKKREVLAHEGKHGRPAMSKSQLPSGFTVGPESLREAANTDHPLRVILDFEGGHSTIAKAGVDQTAKEIRAKRSDLVKKVKAIEAPLRKRAATALAKSKKLAPKLLL